MSCYVDPNLQKQYYQSHPPSRSNGLKTMQGTWAVLCGIAVTQLLIHGTFFIREEPVFQVRHRSMTARRPGQAELVVMTHCEATACCRNHIASLVGPWVAFQPPYFLLKGPGIPENKTEMSFEETS